MDIAAFIIGGFLIGFVAGTIYALASTNQMIEAYRAESQRWFKQAMQYLELWMDERNERLSKRNDDKNDSDWWKK